MSAHRHPILINFYDNQPHYNNQRHIVRRYHEGNRDYRSQHNYDLRLIIIRHAQRIDQALGEDWYDEIFQGVPTAPDPAYRHQQLPLILPHRSKTFLYIIDPPITRDGERKALQKGQQLLHSGARIDYCYSSPASRSVITANAILRGMNNRHVPIRIEPVVFEPVNWNSALGIVHGQMEPFMSKTDWLKAHFNVDRRYHRLTNELNLNEDETDYYTRSKYFFDSLIYDHGRNLPRVPHGQVPRRRTTILIVGHSASTEIFKTIALQTPFDARRFKAHCDTTPNLNTIVLERDSVTHIWSLRPVRHY